MFIERYGCFVEHRGCFVEHRILLFVIMLGSSILLLIIGNIV